MDKRSDASETVVDVFNEAMVIQELYLKKSKFKELSMSETHVLDAVDKVEFPSMTNVAKSLSVTMGTLTTAVKKIVEKGHKVHFVADAAMLSVLDKVDIVFIGAETFYPDGTAFNTVGSDILAELCIQHNVPYYVLTPLLKCDIRAIYGIYKETLKTNLRERLAKDWPEDLKQKVDFTSIELVGVDPKLITGYVTEKGILRTSDLYAIVTKED